MSNNLPALKLSDLLYGARKRNAGFARALFSLILALNAFAQPADKNFANQVYSGKWSGAFDVDLPDGKIQINSAVLFLKQNGKRIEGKIGDSENKLSPIKDAQADDQGIRFRIEFDGGKSMVFSLHREGDHLKGNASGETANGKMSGRIDLTHAGNQSDSSPAAVPGIFKEIAEMDNILFRAFNNRDLETVRRLFTKDLEFYHDKDRLTGYEQNMDSFKRHFESPTRVRRELVEGTLEVCPLNGFGAVETGIQRFYSTDNGQPEKLTATAKFVHVWQKKDGEWKICRVISYDHH